MLIKCAGAAGCASLDQIQSHTQNNVLVEYLCDWAFWTYIEVPLSLANVVVVKVWKELQKVVITEIPPVADSTYSPVRVTKVNRKLNCLWPNFIWILKVFQPRSTPPYLDSVGSFALLDLWIPYIHMIFNLTLNS